MERVRNKPLLLTFVGMLKRFLDARSVRSASCVIEGRTSNLDSSRTYTTTRAEVFEVEAKSRDVIQGAR